MEHSAKQKIIPIVIASLSLGLIFDWFFYNKTPGVSVFLYTALILGFTCYFAYRFRKRLNRSVYWLAPLILLFAFMVLWRANQFLAFINICLVIYLLLLVACLSQRSSLRLERFSISQYLNLIPIGPLAILGETFRFLPKLIDSRQSITSKSSAIPIIRGVILSLPVLVVFLILLSSADLVFQEYIGSLFSWNISPDIIVRWGLIGFVASIFMGAFAFVFMPSSELRLDEPTEKKFRLGATESSIILGSVGVLFLFFVMIQMAYLFGGTDHISSQGYSYTYAEYARKGFFELIAVAAISLLLILLIRRIADFRTILQSMTFKWLSAVLIIEVAIIMLSAHMRLNLYEEAYGFTTLRLLSHLFILWLAAAFAILLINMMRDEDDKSFAFQIFISVLCFFAIVNLVNPDRFIAQQNVNRLNETGKIDMQYLGSLSDDATPTIARLLNHRDERVRDSAANVLYQQRASGMGDEDHWQSANASRHLAEQIYRKNAEQIKAGSDKAISNELIIQ